MDSLLDRLAPLRGIHVLVTGHTGFKGSWLVLWLRELGASVTGIALDPPTSPSLFADARCGEGIADHRLDIRDATALRDLLREARPDVVMHLAAQPLVRASYSQSRETFDINVMGTVHVLEAARDVDSVRALVHVGTDKVYENMETLRGYRETDPLGGHDPYSASKAAAEIAFQSYARSFYSVHGRPLAASGRAGNVIGGGDWARDRIVPDAMRALAEGRPIPVRNPASTRPWQHVLEALSGYLILAADLLAGRTSACGSWNFGPPESNVKRVDELVPALVAGWGAGSWTHTPEPGAVHEAKLLTLSCAKAARELGWMPRWNFAETTRRVAGWYRSCSDGADARAQCLRDIHDYQHG
ncbi:MAG TPA: CDP-glucose 4,6-dehydratase [Kiritimatiellia bacterium]|nr:CDP-glucose 4,6-dehydratase [Kiritimatiellia bacterium]